MSFNKLRLVLFLKIISVFILSYVLIRGVLNIRKQFSSFFDTHCIDYRQKDFNRNLNDKIIDYSAAAKLRGIKPCNDDKEIKSRIGEGKLVKVNSGSRYVVDRMVYSSPYLTKDTKKLLDEISERLTEKTLQEGLQGVRIVITSMTRKTESLKRLRRYNQNASDNSPHLYGNAFDISYKRFIVRKWVLTNCDKKFLKDALGEVIWQLKEEKRCWATYEKGQSCFHVVCR
jgi:uncharacterized protein YcbK (DUF882 family)